MHLPDKNTEELFGLLDRLSKLEDEELLGQFTSDNIDAIRRLSLMLKERMDLERVLSENRFIKVVHELAETRNIWTVRLEETITSAASEVSKGNRVQALWILNGFIRFCPSSYFRKIAEEVMWEYEGQEPGDRSQ